MSEQKVKSLSWPHSLRFCFPGGAPKELVTTSPARRVDLRSVVCSPKV